MYMIIVDSLGQAPRFRALNHQGKCDTQAPTSSMGKK